ncbi:MAG: hypothetical protein AUH33_02300 [Chloroflexi bacterium 13_1_40CM_68_21]|nr:MAG: hypothetical protein AUH33_02300 [Chloroflexi bacterium 13_1_40CM_68_21]
MTDTLLRNVARVATGDVQRPLIDGPTDIRIVEGVIASVGPSAADSADTVIDASHLLVMPGLWDAHHHPYFGDHTPQFDARGYLAETVRAGTTTIVSAGTIDFPGRPRDAAGERELAILAQRSWIHDRPLEINVLSNTVTATTGLEERDFAVLARAGIRRMVVQTPLPTAAETRRQVAWARANGMRIMAHADGPTPLVRDAGSVGEALAVIDPDIVLAVNGGDVALPDAVIDELVRRSRSVLEVSLTGNLKVARRVVAALVAGGEPERVILGTDTPSARGVVAPGVQRLIQHMIGAAPSVSSAMAIAFATGNTARAYVAPGGRVAVGEPADVILCRAPPGSSFEDALDAFEHGDWLDIDSVFIAGAPQVAGQRLVAAQSHPLLAIR